MLHVAVSVQVSAEHGIAALGKAHRTPLHLSGASPRLPSNSANVWLNTDRSRPHSVECRLLPFSTPFSLRQSMLWYSGLSMFRKFLKSLSTSALPSCRPDVTSANNPETTTALKVSVPPCSAGLSMKGLSDWAGNIPVHRLSSLPVTQLLPHNGRTWNQYVHIGLVAWQQVELIHWHSSHKSTAGWQNTHMPWIMDVFLFGTWLIPLQATCFKKHKLDVVYNNNNNEKKTTTYIIIIHHHQEQQQQ